jgi:hypothetical protein
MNILLTTNQLRAYVFYAEGKYWLILSIRLQNEMQKLVGENGPKGSSENKNTKHHPLLLQVSSFVLLPTYSSIKSCKK